MRLLSSFTIFALVGLLTAAPTSDDDDEKVVITKSVYVNEFMKYKAEHDIVNIIVPLNSINFEDDSSSSESKEDDPNIYVFFVEADIDTDGNRIYQGLYVYKDGKVKKLLDEGRDAAASGDDSKKVYFGAKDGLYVFNPKTNAADKLDTISDSIIALAKEKEGEVLYYLTEDHVLYKTSAVSGIKEKVEDVVNAKQIVLDYSNNLYFYSDNKQAFVRTADGITKIEGLPENPTSVNLIKPPFILEDSVPFVVDNKVYIIYANGTSEDSGFEFKPKALPTAFGPEAGLIQYYAYDKKIYEYNLLALIVGSVLEDLKNYINENTNEIKSIASQKKGNGLISKS